MKISILMTTYNGEKFILKQAQSILSQTLKADEVIICDDCSVDKTYEIIEDFIKNNNLNNWHLKRNVVNIGWRKNFFSGLNYVTGDIIFLSDQDDIWENDKLQIMTEKMMPHSNIMALTGYLTLIDDDDRSLPNNKNIPFYGIDTNELSLNKFTSRSPYTYVLGCTLAIRKDLIKYINYLNDEDMYYINYDLFLWRVATFLDGAYYLNKRIVKYRIHNTNTSGATTEDLIGKTDIATRCKFMEEHIKFIEKFLTIMESTDTTNKEYKTAVFDKSSKIAKLRIDLLKQKKIINIPLLFFNHEYYLSFSVFLGDIAYLLNINRFAGKFYRWITES
jgi:glycosyltransferase involved in cell wall biosynthesis